MKRKRHGPEQVIRKLREADRTLAMKASDIARGVILVGLAVSLGCQTARRIETGLPDPRSEAVPLAASGGFDAYLVHRSDVGVWTVKCVPVFERYGCPEIVALDDAGRCTILVSYSGKWTPWNAVHDGQWLGGIAHGDVDHRRPGKELYVGGKRGNLYQICPLPQGGFDTNVIAHLPGREIHTLVVGDLDQSRAGTELLAFTRPGGLYLVEPLDEPGTSFECRQLQELPGRVRDAAVLGGTEGDSLSMVTVSRAGEVALLRLDSGKPSWTTIYRTKMGLGRIAVREPRGSEPIVLYVTADDGRVIRLESSDGTRFEPEVIYAGPQGPRGIVAGQFHEDPKTEAVAIFGYSKKIELITRGQGRWNAETIFVDIDKGHWLTAGELDGRNGTDELIASGYGSRVILLTRPPGYGLGRTTTRIMP